MHAFRSHLCVDLAQTKPGESVRLSGWVHRIRDHGGLLFVDLRDHSGLVQCVANSDSDVFAKVESLRSEACIRLDGVIRLRASETVNAALPTGRIEVEIADVEVLGASRELPMPVFGESHYPEDVRLRYRFLDLRREEVRRNILKRSAIVSWLRKRMEADGFIEFQTPILTASSPEGARDFLVPSRLHPGKVYALPQAPQQFKQLVMLSGFHRYFQIAPCFRDEDARADRSPGEFYQLDIEMSFVTQADVFRAVEPIIAELFETFGEGKSVSKPFPTLTFDDAMLRYGTDKPDTRFGMEICDLSDCFMHESVRFQVFRKLIEKGGCVRAIPAPGASNAPRSFFDRINTWARENMQAPGLGYVILGEEKGELVGYGPIAKFIPNPVIRDMAKIARVKAGDALFFAAGKPDEAARLAGEARTYLAKHFNLIPNHTFDFVWVVDFPMFDWDPIQKRIDFSHNPFSMPQGGMEALENKNPLEIKAFQYDLVCNGVELSSGAIRNHRPDIMRKAFAIAGYSDAELEARFGGMLRALHYGPPPHGGIAPGLDRMVMMLCGASSLRDVTLFPLNQRADDLLLGAPTPPDPNHLAQLGLRFVPPPKG